MNQLQFEKLGYQTVENVFSESEIDTIINCIESSTLYKNKNSSHSENIFSIRKLLKIIPELKDIILNEKLLAILMMNFNSDSFISKAIYFDKPQKSNWFVPYHQDMSISVNKRADLEGFSNWTVKKGYYGVQPPLSVLKNTVTVRIHLDKTTKENGALKVVPKSHLNGIIHNNVYKNYIKNDIFCEVNKGGIMLMKPLLLHASERTSNNKKRRVLHIEFNTTRLPEELEWYEYSEVLN